MCRATESQDNVLAYSDNSQNVAVSWVMLFRYYFGL